MNRAKIVATIVTYPYIMAKLRLQYKGSSSSSTRAYTGTLDVIFRTLKYEGISGLYTGLSAQMLKSVLGAALMFTAKEKLDQFRDMIINWYHMKNQLILQKKQQMLFMQQKQQQQEEEKRQS